jgi:hypothetical protein
VGTALLEGVSQLVTPGRILSVLVQTPTTSAGRGLPSKPAFPSWTGLPFLLGVTMTFNGPPMWREEGKSCHPLLAVGSTERIMAWPKSHHCSANLMFSFFISIEELFSGDTLWHLHMCLQYILIRFNPSITLPHLPCTPLRRTISTGFIILFSYRNTKYICHICPPSPFALSPPLGTPPLPSTQTGPVLPSCP